jgi:hypothetical protein
MNKLQQIFSTQTRVLRNAVTCIFLLAVQAISAFGQTPTPPSDPLETGWNVMVNGGYSSVSNATTNNGFFFSTGIRLSQHLVARGDVFVVASPAVTVSLAKPEYRFSALHLFKRNTTQAVKNTEFFVNAGIGAAHYTDPAKGGQSKFAYGFGGGFDVKMSDTITVRPLDVNYVRSTLLNGGKVIGNHLQFAAGLGLRF